MARRGSKGKQLPAALVERYRRGELNADQVARLAGMYPDTALRKLREAGVDTSQAARTRLRFARDQEGQRRRERAVALYRSGLSLIAVARRVGVTHQAVRLMLIRAGVPRRPKGGRWKEK